MEHGDAVHMHINGWQHMLKKESIKMVEKEWSLIPSPFRMVFQWEPRG